MDENKDDPTYYRCRAEEFRRKAAAATDGLLRAGLEAMARELEQRARCLSARKRRIKGDIPFSLSPSRPVPDPASLAEINAGPSTL